jgi:cell division protein FtsZ
MMAQPARATDAIADQIRAAEAALERELEIALARQDAAVQMAAPVAAPQPVASAPADDFRPQSKLFSSFATSEQPVARAPAPAPMAAAPAPQPAPQAFRQEPVAPVMRQPEPVRMPKVEDFSPVVQAEMEHRNHAAAAQATEDRGPMGLLRRITSSLGRQEDADVAPAAPAAPAQQRRPLSAEASVYAPRRGNLDDQGRQVPQARASHDDDQLEIPAFLRRQSN